jgi:hypothetical protein
VYQCCWRICREIKCFSRFEYHMFYVLYSFATYLLTLPRKWAGLKANAEKTNRGLCVIWGSHGGITVMFFWFTTPSSSVNRRQHSGRTCYLDLHCTASYNRSPSSLNKDVLTLIQEEIKRKLYSGNVCYHSAQIHCLLVCCLKT